MKILYLLIPLSLIFVGAAVWVLLWAVRSGQYEDMEGSAHRILMDDDDPRIPHRKRAADAADTQDQDLKDKDE